MIYVNVNQCVKFRQFVIEQNSSLYHCELSMLILDRGISVIAAEVSTMSQAREVRTISGGAWLSLSVAGLALLIIGPVFAKAQSFSRASKETSSYKGFSGLWARSDSVKQVYYHDQTVAVVELGPGRSLENCELVEVT